MENILTYGVTEYIQEMALPVIFFIISLSISASLIPVIIKTSIKHGWVDMPNHRKIHKTPIPRFGGIAIFSGFFFPVFVYSLVWNHSLLPYLTAISFIFFMGISDDNKDLPATLKFALQIVITTGVAAYGIRIESLHGILNIYTLPVPVQYLLTIIIITGLINAYNLIDGIDGLAGGLTLINSIIFGILFISKHNLPLALLSFSLGGAALGFLFFNFKKAKIFMGDGGSLTIGITLALLGIAYFRLPETENSAMNLNLHLLVYASMLLPVYDTLRVFMERISRGISPFTAEKNHIHHLLLKTGFDQVKTVTLIYGYNFSLIILSLLLKGHWLKYGAFYLFFTAVLLSELITLKMLVQSIFRKRTIKSDLNKIINRNYLLERNIINGYEK